MKIGQKVSSIGTIVKKPCVACKKFNNARKLTAALQDCYEKQVMQEMPTKAEQLERLAKNAVREIVS